MNTKLTNSFHKPQILSLASTGFHTASTLYNLLLYLWGISMPPSTAPFITANTRLPVVVRVSPTSRKARNGRAPSPVYSTEYSSPFASSRPSYLSARSSLASTYGQSNFHSNNQFPNKKNELPFWPTAAQYSRMQHSQSDRPSPHSEVAHVHRLHSRLCLLQSWHI